MRLTGWLGAGVARVRKGIIVALLGLLCFGGIGAVVAESGNQSGEIIQGFTERQDTVHGVQEIEEKRKHQIMFLMGAALLIGILTTAGLGIAMAIYGKEVFLAHMLAAGFSVFLAVAHSVTAVVWFFPF